MVGVGISDCVCEGVGINAGVSYEGVYMRVCLYVCVHTWGCVCIRMCIREGVLRIDIVVHFMTHY